MYSLGTYQQMYITGSTTLHHVRWPAPTPCPVTNSHGGLQLKSSPPTTSAPPAAAESADGSPTRPGYRCASTTDAYVARFNANGLAASSFGGQGALAWLYPLFGAFPNMGYGFNESTADRLSRTITRS